MNRRNFIRSMLVAVAVATAPPILRVVLRDAHVPKVLVANWLQTTRYSSNASPEYLRALEEILRSSEKGDAYINKFNQFKAPFRSP